MKTHISRVCAGADNFTFSMSAARLSGAVGFILLLGLLTFPRSASAQTYTLTDLGTLGGSGTVGYGINASGQVTGNSYTAGGVRHAFIFDPHDGTLTDLGTLGGESFGTAINNSGQVTGRSNGFRAFITGPNGVGMRDLTMLPPLYDSYGAAINNSGQVTGWVAFLGADLHVFISDPRGRALRILKMGGEGLGINDLGQVTGSLELEPVAHAFIFDPHDGTLTDLGTLAGPGGLSVGLGINDLSQVTGSSQTTMAGNVFHAFITGPNGGTLTDLGTLGGTRSDGESINNSGQVTGSSFTQNGASRAFLYHNGQMIDLNTLVSGPLAAYVTLSDAPGINNASWIVANGSDSRTGETHAYLLKPIGPP